MCEAGCRCSGDGACVVTVCCSVWSGRLFQVKMEREQYQTEIRDLQDQLSEMHDELDGAKTVVADREKDAMMEVKHRPGPTTLRGESVDIEELSGLHGKGFAVP